MVALVGPSGGGKSTIVNLIEHFYDLSDGNILISKTIKISFVHIKCFVSFTTFNFFSLYFKGGHNVKDLDPSWYRRHIGIVNQEPVLFATTIKDNIAFGKESATQDEVRVYCTRN